MNNQQVHWVWIIAGLAVFSSGCCCVDSYCNSCEDYGGAGCVSLGGGCGSCNSGCGSSYSCAGTGAGCNSCTSSCTSSGLVPGGWGLGSGRFFGGQGNGTCGWGFQPEVFVDSNGQPCWGPFFGIANFLRDSFRSCGCGELYVDEWISDPPLCRDPCGDILPRTGGCGSCNSCAPCSANLVEHHFESRRRRWGNRSSTRSTACGCSRCRQDEISRHQPRPPRSQYARSTSDSQYTRSPSRTTYPRSTSDSQYTRSPSRSTKQYAQSQPPRRPPSYSQSRTPSSVQRASWSESTRSVANSAKRTLNRVNPLDAMSEKVRQVHWFD